MAYFLIDLLSIVILAICVGVLNVPDSFNKPVRGITPGVAAVIFSFFYNCTPLNNAVINADFYKVYGISCYAIIHMLILFSFVLVFANSDYCDSSLKTSVKKLGVEAHIVAIMFFVAGAIACWQQYCYLERMLAIFDNYEFVDVWGIALATQEYDNKINTCKWIVWISEIAISLTYTVRIFVLKKRESKTEKVDN